MNKVQIFLPLPGMTDAMDAYFTRPNTFYLAGLPTGAELPAADLPEAEILEIALEAAKDKLARATLWEDEEYTIDTDAPFMEEFYNGDGERLGWEFEFRAYAY